MKVFPLSNKCLKGLDLLDALLEVPDRVLVADDLVHRQLPTPNQANGLAKKEKRK